MKWLRSAVSDERTLCGSRNVTISIVSTWLPGTRVYGCTAKKSSARHTQKHNVTYGCSAEAPTPARSFCILALRTQTAKVKLLYHVHGGRVHLSNQTIDKRTRCEPQHLTCRTKHANKNVAQGLLAQLLYLARRCGSVRFRPGRLAQRFSNHGIVSMPNAGVHLV